MTWEGDRLLVKNLSNGDEIRGTDDVVSALNAFYRPRTAESAANALADYERASVLRTVRRLLKLGLLLPAKQASRRVSRLKAWGTNLASAYYHVATRDVPYLQSIPAIERQLKEAAAISPPPPNTKRYRSALRVRLPAAPLFKEPDPAALSRILNARRTVREFSRKPVELERFAAIIRGTWGLTACFDSGVTGPLIAKTSPSAGSLHPIESYIIVWNVVGLRPGLYHYDVKGDELRRLRSGDFRREAVRAASGQRWVGRSAFLCVMTAVFERTLWKYSSEAAFRVLWLDAGHLGQTFALLATAHGLGPYQTAAIQDSFIEKLLGINGIHEFPVYLCGAGTLATAK
jgi:SagB-type dehydrogenase family enzyme